MSTRISRSDRYRGEIVQMEDEKFGCNHHHHVTHNTEPRNKGPYREDHPKPEGRRSPEASRKAKESSGSASKRHESKHKHDSHHSHPEE